MRSFALGVFSLEIECNIYFALIHLKFRFQYRVLKGKNDIDNIQNE